MGGRFMPEGITLYNPVYYEKGIIAAYAKIKYYRFLCINFTHQAREIIN